MDRGTAAYGASPGATVQFLEKALDNFTIGSTFWCVWGFNWTPGWELQMWFGPASQPSGRMRLWITTANSTTAFAKLTNGSSTVLDSCTFEYSPGEAGGIWVSYSGNGTAWTGACATSGVWGLFKYDSGEITPGTSVAVELYGENNAWNSSCTLGIAGRANGTGTIAAWVQDRYNSVEDARYKLGRTSVLCYSSYNDETGLWNHPYWDWGDIGMWSKVEDTSCTVTWHEWLGSPDCGLHGWWKLSDAYNGKHCELKYNPGFDEVGSVEFWWVMGDVSTGYAAAFIFCDLYNGPTGYVIIRQDRVWVYNITETKYVAIAPAYNWTPVRVCVGFNTTSQTTSVWVNGEFKAEVPFIVSTTYVVNCHFKTDSSGSLPYWFAVHAADLRFDVPGYPGDSIIVGYVNETGLDTLNGFWPCCALNVTPPGEETLFLQGPAVAELALSSRVGDTVLLPVGWDVWWYGLYNWSLEECSGCLSGPENATVWTDWNSTGVSAELVMNESLEYTVWLAPRYGVQDCANLTVYIRAALYPNATKPPPVWECTFAARAVFRYVVVGRIPAAEYDLLNAVVGMAAPFLLVGVFPYLLYRLTGDWRLSPLGILLAGLTLAFAGVVEFGVGMLLAGLGAVGLVLTEGPLRDKLSGGGKQ